MLHGPMTATEVGEKIGESATTASFHLRQLAKYGFVEEAGGGKGRARPWRLVSIGMSFGDGRGDPETQVAAGVLGRLLRERQLERYWTWRQTRSSYPLALCGRKPSLDSEYLVHLTVDELNEINQDLVKLLHSRYRERMTDPRSAPPTASSSRCSSLFVPHRTQPGAIIMNPTWQQAPSSSTTPISTDPGVPGTGGRRNQPPSGPDGCAAASGLDWSGPDYTCWPVSRRGQRGQRDTSDPPKPASAVRGR